MTITSDRRNTAPGTSQTREDAAAEALAGMLPTTTTLRPVRLTGAQGAADGVPPADAPLAEAVIASFVGAASADLAVVLTGSSAVDAAAGADSPLVAVADMVRPALEAATGVLGAGVLDEPRQSDAAALFAAADTAVYALQRHGATEGWFAIRIREAGSVAAGANAPDLSLTDESMAAKLGRINNVEMSLTVEIGRTRMSVRDVLNLEPGAVIELDRSAGAPADVLLNGRLIAHGEVVVVDQDYAVRITKILDIADGLS